jgi:UDP-N-acetylmuramoyl-tripeptide--D-alanyl-D-alanine ligase
MTIFGLSTKHELMLLELGTNEPGEVDELGRIASPTCAILTLIALEHTEGLGDLDGVEREEAAIFKRLMGPGVAIGNADDPRVARQLELAGAARVLRYGIASGGLVELVGRRLVTPQQVSLDLRIGGRPFVVNTTLQGSPGVLAALASLTAVEALLPGALNSEVVAEALRGPFEAGRAQLMKLKNGAFVLDDTYNSNPASLRESVRTGAELARFTGGKLFVVAGEMRELGALSSEAHRDAGAEMVPLAPHRVFGLVGDASLIVDATTAAGIASEFFSKVADVAPRVLETLSANDVVVVKASRGVAAEGVVAGLAMAVGLLETSATHEPAPADEGAPQAKL